MLILHLWGISFHAVVVFGLGKNLLFKSVLGHCVGARVGILSQPSGRLSDESWKVARLARGSLDIYQNFREIVATKSTLVGTKLILQFQILKPLYETVIVSQSHQLFQAKVLMTILNL